MNTTSFSIVMNGASSCNMNCRYCAGADETKVKITHLEKPNPIDWNKLLSSMKRNPNLHCDNGAWNIDHIEIWGGEPLIYKDLMVELMDGLTKEFGVKKYFFSTNGILLAKRSIIDWILDESKYHIDVQLSHDGLGQWIRSGSFDPLYDDVVGQNILEIAKSGHLSDINCVLNKLNPSPIDNMSYYNKWMSDNHIQVKCIQLNHMQDTPNIINHLVNPHTGEEWNNISLNLEGDSLRVYFNELFSLFIEMFIGGKMNDPSLAPYAEFIERFSRAYGHFMKDKDEPHMSCRSFARGKQDFNFAIDTKGNYCECILYDSDHETPNHNCNQPDYCKDCEFYNYSTCNGCPDQWYMSIPNHEHCQFHKEYARYQERIHQIDRALTRSPSRGACK